ncbi:xanthine dehydrogenase family protein molybdopterin-binding subunit [Hankyongella ginsenosidimutans]|uniref:xanthine dehydrogenase family protein molybdopterin-binding subunit n=1 Tax=Hankyongella ginsenosidimutans TaxID=1763828 RepID=UPI001FE4FBD8|nr:molybdopterin cofactor-binding domain-containing protein [Hankyongella ginsenosidimutans]
MDVKLDGMLIAVIARTPRFGGTVKAFDASKAKAMPGVVDVVQVPSGVAVLAKNTWAARQGRDALAVTWDDSKVEKRSSAQFEADYKALAAKGGGRSVTAKGDAGKALAGATKVIEADYVFPFLAHAPMEPMTCAGRLVDGKCEMWAGFQIPTVDQGRPPQRSACRRRTSPCTCSRRGQLRPSCDADRRLHRRTGKHPESHRGKYPVKLVWTREDDIQGGYYRPFNVHRIRAGLDASGKIVGWDQSFVGQSILAGTPFGAPDGSDPAAYEGHAGEQYDIPNAAVRWIKAESPVSVLWWRSVGHTHSAYSKEVMMDELAAAGKDPLEFRLAHLGKHPRHAAVLKLAAEKPAGARRCRRARRAALRCTKASAASSPRWRKSA